VTIDSLTTADSQTQAMPGGTLATTTTVMPTRMQNTAGAWENIDPTLTANSNGGISTTATPNGLTLSGGGTGPVITATDAAGHSLALSLPVTLPAPTLSGASATYANVYPGVSLTVTAQPSGGFSEVFEIQNAAALAQAQNLKFTTQTSGLTLSQAADGTLDALDSSSGQPVMTAPPAIEWDSATGGAPANDVPDDFETVTNSASSTAGPGLGAHTGALPVTESGSTLTLAGGTSTLDTTTPTYPLYLDPTYTWTEPYQSGGTNNYTEVQSGCPTVANWDDVTEPGVGYNNLNGDGNCPGYGAYESYFDLDTANLNSQDTIVSSIMKINEVYSADDSCGEGTQTITVKWTDSISSSTTWNTRPAVISTLPDPTALKTDGNSDGTMCSGNAVAGNFDLESAIASNAASNGTHITFGLFGDESGSWESLERFNDNPSVTTTYDIPPNAPADPTTWPVPVTGVNSAGQLATTACPSSTTPGYLGIGNIGGTDGATFSANLTSPIAAAQMNATFTLHNVTTNTTTGTYTSSGYATTSGADVSVAATSLTNGDEYSWSATASDQYFTSTTPSTTCYFTVDTTPPTNPSISSASWPTLASGTTSTVDAGTQGSFTLASTDAISGVAGYYYSIDADPIPSSGGTFQTGTTLTYTPTSWGAHTLYVQTLDNAGNVSAVNSYSFYVPWNPTSSVATGSITGGDVPDLITNPSTGTNAGSLVMVPGDSNPDATPTIVSTQADSPDATSWTNFQITHDGSLTNHPGYDDLWAFQNTTDKLYLYLNNQSAAPFETTANLNPISKGDIDSDAFNNAFNTAQNDGTACVTTSSGSCSTYDDSDWTQLTQILAPGDLYAGDTNATASTGAVDNEVPGLLTVEGGSLWYYQGQAGSEYLNIVEQLGTSGWDGTTLIGTTTTGTGSSTHTYLWARINTGTEAGAIMQYPIGFDTAGNLKSLETPTSGSGTQIDMPDAANADAGTSDDLATAAYLQLYAWDMHHTGNSDLIATTPSGTVIDWPSTGTGQFANPESLAAATSSTAITLASAGTDYPSGTTWDDGTATLGFNQGQLTVTLDATGQVLTQYGVTSPGAYLTLQTDGNLVIYSATGSALWALGGLNVPYAAGDSLQLSGSTLTLNSSTGPNLWTAENSVPTTTSTIGETAFTTPAGDLAITVGAGTLYTTDAIATGTSPTIADLGSGTYEVAFQGTNGDLETYSSTGTTTNTTQAMAPGTSPSIAPMPGATWLTAFQALDTHLEWLSNTGTLTTSSMLMATDTSPDLGTNPAGGWEIAYSANTDVLWTHNANGTTTNTTEAMDAGTSPATVCLTTSGSEILYQASNNDLYSYSPTGTATNLNYGMKAGTNPAIAALANGGWQAAWQANTGILFTAGSAPGSNTTQAMATGTSPSIAATGGDSYALAWQSSTNTLNTMAYGSTATNTGNTMSSTTSPSLAP
jgi:hypothetical protein